MNALIAQIVDRCEALIAGLVLSDASGGGLVQVPVYAHALPIATSGEEKAEQVPSVVVRLVGLEESAGKMNPLVRIMGEIYTEDGVEEGMTDLLALVDRLRPLVVRGPENIQGYKLLPPIVWQVGDRETGNQPHPFYNFQMDLRFSGV